MVKQEKKKKKQEQSTSSNKPEIEGSSVNGGPAVASSPRAGDCHKQQNVDDEADSMSENTSEAVETSYTNDASTTDQGTLSESAVGPDPYAADELDASPRPFNHNHKPRTEPRRPQNSSMSRPKPTTSRREISSGNETAGVRPKKNWAPQASDRTKQLNQTLRERYLATEGIGMTTEEVKRAKILLERSRRKREKRTNRKEAKLQHIREKKQK